MPMDQAIKAQWITDLRDPNRKQCTGKLRNRYGAQCCLDVLTEQAVKAGVLPEPVLEEYAEHSFDGEPVMVQAEEYSYHYTKTNGDEGYETELLPEVVWHWAGLESNNPEVFMPEEDEDGGYQVTLIELNDVHGSNFLEIADLIEADPEI